VSPTEDPGKDGMDLAHVRSAQMYYLELRSKGYGPVMASRKADISYETIKNRRRIDPAFATAEREMAQLAVERIDQGTMYEAAMAGDINAAEKWLKAHDRENWGADRKITFEHNQNISITATTEGIMALQAALAERKALAAGDDYIEAEVISDDRTDA
jgi:hypothetical protein